MINEIQKTMLALLAQSENCANGAARYGDNIGLKLNLEAAIRADRTALLDERDRYEAAKTVLSGMKANFITAIADGREFLMVARDSLKPRFRKRYSEAWDPTGFVGSLAIPFDADAVQSLLQLMQRFYAANPALQKADSNATAARAEVLFNAITTAKTGIHTQTVQVQNMLASRNAKAAKLRKRLSGLVSELKQLLPPLDNRWLAFGLNKPGAAPTPAAPLNVTTVLIGPNAVSVQWAQSTYASYYRVWAKVEGVDLDIINIGDTTNLEFTMQELAAGTQVRIAVSAVSTGGESGLSEIVMVAMPQ